VVCFDGKNENKGKKSLKTYSNAFILFCLVGEKTEGKEREKLSSRDKNSNFCFLALSLQFRF